VVTLVRGFVASRRESHSWPSHYHRKKYRTH